MRKKILAVLGILLVSILFLNGCKKKDTGPTRIALTYYKLYDDEDVMRPIIEAYQRQHPNVTIRYRKFTDPEAYEDLILNELAEGEGPDIFEVSNLSLPRFFKKIKPLSSSSYTPQVFRDTYVAVAGEDFLHIDPSDNKEKIYGIPMTVDTPVLYYNKEIYEAKIPEKGKPGALWDDFIDDAFLLREENFEAAAGAAGASAGSGTGAGTATGTGASGLSRVSRGAIAFGRADNINGAVDALLNLMLQESVSFYDSGFEKATFASRGSEAAFDFYTSFADSKQKQFSWDEFMVDASSDLKEIEAFLSGKVVAILGYSDLLPNFSVYLRNVKAKGLKTISEGDIGFVPLPQNTERPENKVVLAKYRAQTVSRTSKNSFAAWDFIAFLTSRDQAKKYTESLKKPAARRDLIESQKKDADMSVFVSQTGYAKSIPMRNEQKYRELFIEAIQKSVTGEQSSGLALRKVQDGVDDLMGGEGLFSK